jgi:putative restriction endonuclease
MLRQSVLRTRYEKAAWDAAFDLEPTLEGDWLAIGTSHATVRGWLSSPEDGVTAVALSQDHVCAALSESCERFEGEIPPGAAGAVQVTSFDALTQLLRRSLTLARTLPNALLETFVAKVSGLPRSTEAERLTVQRVGQDVFRAGLLDYWGGRCPISGLAVPELLRASHIKPWAHCATDAERLDVFNGLLLAAHLDAAFDAGLITVKGDGLVILATTLDLPTQAILGLEGERHVAGVTDSHRHYLAWHRANVFRPEGKPRGFDSA